jgi:hypothetical protein
MRIQETDRILKESRYSRQPVCEQEHENVLTRAWHALAHLPTKVMEKMHR